MTAEAGAPAACDEAAAVPVTSGDAAVPGDEPRAAAAAPASAGPGPDPAPPAGRALIPPPGSALPGGAPRSGAAAPASAGPVRDPAPPAGRALTPPPGSPFPPFAHLPVVVRCEIATLTCRPEDACDATWTAPDAQYTVEAAMAAARREGWGYGGWRLRMCPEHQQEPLPPRGPPPRPEGPPTQ